MSNSQNTENEQQNNLCTTLTEQWKKGELKEGFYYFRMPDGTTDIASEYKLIRYILVRDADKIEVLEPVPSYEEWQQLHKFLEEFNALDVAKENQQLKEKLEKAEATLLDIDGGWVTDEIRSKVSEYFVYAIGEKK